jgi:predicted nicotinamide N-methyase
VPCLRRARRALRVSSPSLLRPIDVVEQTVTVAGRDLRVVRPRDPDELLDEEAFEHEEFLPYWAELWPSALKLAEAVGDRDLRGRRVIELGCGLALPGIVAALEGARVLATDWSEDAIEFAARNARLNDADLETLLCSWTAPHPLVDRGPFDLVLASDVLYERRNVGPLLELLPSLSGEVLLADPGRPALREFLDRAAESWEVEATGTLYRLELQRWDA